MFGADEAGYGSLLGSMFVSCVSAENISVLPDGVVDSKKLSMDEVRRLAKEIHTHPDINVAVYEVPPERFRDNINCEDLVVDAHARVINSVSNSHEIGFVDASGNCEKSFCREISRKINKRVKIVSKYGADERFKMASAASIIAKHAREQNVQEIKSDISQDIGSGYPGDDKTDEFIETHYNENGELPKFARKSLIRKNRDL